MCVHIRRLHLIPTGAGHTLWKQFQRGLTDHCFCLSRIPLSPSLQAAAFHSLVNCQLLPSKSDVHNCSTKILWEVTHLQYCTFLCPKVYSGSLVSEKNSCNARSSRILGFSSRGGNGGGMLPLFIASLSSSFSMASRTWYDALSVPVKTSRTRDGDGERGSSSSRVDSWFYGELAKRSTPSQTDVMFFVKNALVNMCEDDLIAIRNVTAMSLMIAMLYAHALRLSRPNPLIANKNARAFGLSSSLARQMMKIRKKYSRSKTVSILKNSSPRRFFFTVFCFLVSSSFSLAFNFASDLPRRFLKGLHEKSQEWEGAKTNRLVVSKDLCFGAPRLVWIDEHHNLEVQTMGLSTSVEFG